MLLSGFSRIKKGARVLDLGSGCATLGLLLCARHPECTVTGLELDPLAHQAALDNIARNKLDGFVCSVCADLRSISSLPNAGRFDVCVSNPPYFTGGPASERTPQARRDDTCSCAELFDAAARALRWGGDFFLVHKPERLAQLCACAAQAGLEPKRLQLVRHAPDKEINLILLACRKGGKPGLTLEELCLHDSAGAPTEAYRKLYHI